MFGFDFFSDGTITIDTKKYMKDLIIFPDHIISNWRRKNGHLLTKEDIKEIIEYEPEILIIGTGSMGLMKVDESLIKELKSLGIKPVIKKTADAVIEYNRIYKDKEAVAALHLTC
jgi:hypothetical protein